MTNTIRRLASSQYRWLVAVFIVGALSATAWAMRAHWWPLGSSYVTASADTEHSDDSHGHEHADEHSHDHAGHAEANSIELSQQALKNVGYQPVTVALGNFERTVTLPAIVVEQPGRTQVHVTAPLTGVITKIYAASGEAIEPGSDMFEVRLTHEELVTSQKEYLQTLENLDVVNREIGRLKSLGEGVIAGKRVLEQEYEKQRLEASLRAAEEALLLHGLNEEQVQQILKNRRLLKSLTIRAPDHSHTGDESCADHWFHVQSLPVSPGQQVDAGQELSVLADYCELFVEGRAFEDDAKRLRKVAQEGWDISATHLTDDKESERIEGLKLLYLADKIDPESRAFHFYVRLPNQVALDQTSPSGRRFIEWHFKPGQRMELNVPMEEWVDCIVLPVVSVIEEGAETYVYRQTGDHFDRVPVHVQYRDRDSVVIANDGAIFPGDIVASQGAYQIHLALKNKSGGGIDPHAGHNH